MNAKEWLCVIILATTLVLATIHIWPSHREQAHFYSGPGIGGNLIALQVVKNLWEVDHKGGKAWPTGQDLSPYWVKLHGDNQMVSPVYHEIYLINTTSAPVFAYFPKAEYGYHEGETISLNEESKKEVERLVQQNIAALRPNQ